MMIYLEKFFLLNYLVVDILSCITIEVDVCMYVCIDELPFVI